MAWERAIWVVKIGGSLLGSPELERWLEIFAKFSDGNIVIVPGGGLFADAVRDAQKLSKMSDASAHRLAVLAMDQYGLLMASMNPELAIARSEMEIDERTWQHRGIVWLPSQMVLADDSIPQSWDVTSDSIAAWLAEKLGAQHLVLVKSDKPDESELCLRMMTKNGMVDQAFSDFVINKTFGRWMLKKTDFEHFLEGLSTHTLEKIGSSLKVH
ncbi:MAG TPA: uridylate kinase [Methylophilus sp.]|jgi:acetylglutamate kinase|nr:uridylate kinase [Methylophilus sp.]HQQ33637.1 uridylate kinase [Methylophilus sp.]